MTGAGQVCWTSSVQESWYTQRELAVPPHQTQPYFGSAVRHRLQSDRPTEQLNRVTATKQRNFRICTCYSTPSDGVTSPAQSKNSVLTVQVLGAVDVEVVFSPHVDCGCVFLHHGRICILKREQKLTVEAAQGLPVVYMSWCYARSGAKQRRRVSNYLLMGANEKHTSSGEDSSWISVNMACLCFIGVGCWPVFVDW